MTEIVVTDRDGVREVAIDRPAKRNALTRAMYWALAEALGGAAAAGARAIWLHGAPECFCAGNDLGDFARAQPGERSAAIDVLEALLPCPTPIVASVSGPAVGVGATMLLHCDLVYCSAEARFQFPFIDLGICPEAASSLLLPLRAGSVQANAMLLLGEPFDAAAALDARLVNAVLPTPAAAAATGRDRARALAAKPPEALRTSRALLRGDAAATLERMRRESAEFHRLLHSPEARALLQARVDNKQRTP